MANPALSLSLRSLISSVDLSALVLAGWNWNIYQGLNIMPFLSVMTGDDDDIFGWERDSGISISLGLEYIY